MKKTSIKKELYDGIITVINTDVVFFSNNMCFEIMNKGLLKTTFAKYWYKKTEHIIENSLEKSIGNILFFKKCTPLPIKFNITNYLTNNYWKRYKDGCRIFENVKLKDGLKKNDKIDLLITQKFNYVGKDACNNKILDYIYIKCKELFNYVSEELEKKDIILVDTELKFGINNSNKIILIGNCFTFDTTKFWYKTNYEKSLKLGLEPENVIKFSLYDKNLNSIKENIYFQYYKFIKKFIKIDLDNQDLKYIN